MRILTLTMKYPGRICRIVNDHLWRKTEIYGGHKSNLSTRLFSILWFRNNAYCLIHLCWLVVIHGHNRNPMSNILFVFHWLLNNIHFFSQCSEKSYLINVFVYYHLKMKIFTNSYHLFSLLWIFGRKNFDLWRTIRFLSLFNFNISIVVNLFVFFYIINSLKDKV